MRVIFYIILAMFFPCLSYNQEQDLVKDMENTYLQVRQKAGTDRLLEKYLSAADIKEDTVYAFIYRPADCPRCEAPFKLFKKWLNERGKKFLLISVFQDSLASKYYNESKGYEADYNIYDVNEDYKNIFSFNNIPLDGANILKMTKKGRLITGGCFTQFSQLFIKQLIARTEPMPYKSYSGEKVSVAKKANNLIPQSIKEISADYVDIKIDNKNVPICKLTRNPIFEGDVFSYPDDIVNGVLIFNMTGDTLSLSKIAKVDSLEKCRFINIGKALCQDYFKKGMIFDIVCNTNMLGSRNIGVSYSLPKIFYEEGDSNRVAFYNQPCILATSYDKDNNKKTIYPLDFDLEHEKYFYKHFQFSMVGDKVIIGCQKLTWPMEYDAEDYMDDKNRNSFNKDFYDTKNPYMAAFDLKTGKLIGRFGNLDNIAEKTLSGYYFVSPLSSTNGKELAYTDGFSGKVYICDTANIMKPKECLEVFKFNDDGCQNIDTTKFYTYEYVKPFSKLFCRCIKDIRVTKEKLYCIVSYGDYVDYDMEEENTLVVVDRKTRRIKELRFPKEKSFKTFAFGLHFTKDKKVLPFEILKKNEETFIRQYIY